MFKNVPAAHLVHEVELEVAHVPGIHATGASIEEEQNIFSGHTMHSIEPGEL